MGKVAAAIVEGIVVLVIGGAVAVGGNLAMGDEGIDFGRNYFPQLAPPPGVDTRPTTRETGTGNAGHTDSGHTEPGETGTPSSVEPGLAPAKAYDDADWFKDVSEADFQQFAGLAYVPAGKSPSWQFNELMSSQAEAFHAAGSSRGIVFVDSRTDSHYRDGHIPGAVLLSHFHLGRDWPAAQGAVYAAGAIVIYCAGGDCDDSENLAKALVMEKGIPQERIYVYRGGMKDWEGQGRPIAKGE